MTAACPFLSDYVCEYGAGQTAELFIGPDTSVARFIAGAKSGCETPSGRDDTFTQLGKPLADRL
ncbi:hypothetical protein [Amycolatopsis sp. NPDC051061]|uniref:hypothetical protein n=1 Tax=Amycolatopsis sp. NPDC051061 TaxID=3155042 RepID=UPI0034486D18